MPNQTTQYNISINKGNSQQLYDTLKAHNYSSTELNIITSILEKPPMGGLRYVRVSISGKTLWNGDGSTAKVCTISDLEKHLVQYEISELRLKIQQREKEREKYLQKAEETARVIEKHLEEIIKMEADFLK